ncbi:hypothetical protein H5410_000743 [Solanum commersonii]|uniref:Uncharacterized protein n=1 Tax=Solanum commersonii TaxID=4109 RepID=A0A9J6AXM4_SOLCO|nr:hypothetical protein H5410_000743 [Solanum commersonii]
MTEAFKRLNGKAEALLQENAKLIEQVKLFKGKDSSQKVHTGTQTSTPSFPSLDKMDEKAGKDTSNPFMAVTLPKSEDESSSSIRRLPRSFTQEQDKHVITTENPDPSEDRLVPDTKRINTSSRRDNLANNRTRSLSSGEDDYGDHSYYQDAQDSNEDNDSRMSFDSIALHNLDT